MGAQLRERAGAGGRAISQPSDFQPQHRARGLAGLGSLALPAGMLAQSLGAGGSSPQFPLGREGAKP